MFLIDDVAEGDRVSPSPPGFGCELGGAEMNGPLLLLFCNPPHLLKK